MTLLDGAMSTLTRGLEAFSAVALSPSGLPYTIGALIVVAIAVAKLRSTPVRGRR